MKTAFLVFMGLLCAWAGYLLFSHTLLRAMYEHNSIGILNNIIQPHTGYPLDYYYVLTDVIFYGSLAAVLFFTIFFLVLKVSQRVLVSISLTILLLASLEALARIIISPWGIWNGSDLAWAFSVGYGYPLYPALGQGPLLSESYGPLAALVYLPAVVFNFFPTLAVILGSFISAGFYFLPVLWLSLRSSKKYLPALCAFSWFCLFTLNSRSLSYSAFSIHADAPALGLAALACVFLYNRKLSNPVLLVSAFLAVCAVWAKQTMVFMLFILPLWLSLSGNLKSAKRYVAYILFFGSLTLVLFSALFGFKNLYFFMFTYPLGFPWKNANPFTGLLNAGADLFQDYFLFIILALLLVVFSLRRFHSSSLNTKTPLQDWMRDNPWLMFLMSGILLVPASLLGLVKGGGDYNTLSPAGYFFALASVLGLMNYSNGKFNKISRVAFGLLLVSLTFIGILRFRTFLPSLLKVKNNDQETAYKYAKKYPGQAYFPETPLASLLAEGKLYHFQFGVSDREALGIPVSPEYFRAHIPAYLRLVAFPKDSQSQDIMKYLPEFSKRVTIGELPGWTVYVRE